MTEEREIVVLSDSDDDEAPPPPKRVKAEPVKAEPISIDDDDDGEGVEVIQPPAAPPAPVEAPPASQGDEDMIVTSSRGQVALRDFAHARHNCGLHPFKTSVHQTHCPKCHCFVCDVPAAECKSWGLQNFATAHCNAFDCHYWQEERKKKRRDAAPGGAAAAPGPSSGASAGASAAPWWEQENPFEAGYNDDEGYEEGGGFGLFTSSSSYAQNFFMPDPALDKGLLQLGEIEMPFRVVPGKTLQSIKASFKENGIFEDVPRMALQPGNMLSLASLVRATYENKDNYIEMEPNMSDVTTESNIKEPRLREVLVIGGTPATAPPGSPFLPSRVPFSTKYGVTVPGDGKVGDLIEGLKPVLDPPLADNETLIPFTKSGAPSTSRSPALSFVAADKPLSDVFRIGRYTTVQHVHVYRVVCPAGTPRNEVGELDPTIAMVYLDVSIGGSRQSYTASQKAWREESEKRGKLRLCSANPLVIAIDPAHADGGFQANQAIAAALRKMMRPLERQGSGAVLEDAAVVLNRSSSRGDRNSYTGFANDAFRDMKGAQLQKSWETNASSSGLPVYSSDRPYFVMRKTVDAHRGIFLQWLFSKDHFKKYKLSRGDPRVHPSLCTHGLAVASDLDKAEAEHAAALKLIRNKPYELVRSLVSAARARLLHKVRPEDTAYNRVISCKPHARLKCTLEAAAGAEEGEQERGVLRVKVYVARPGDTTPPKQVHMERFFRSHTDGLVRHGANEQPMAEVMRALCKQAGGHAERLVQSIADAKEKCKAAAPAAGLKGKAESAAGSLGALINALESGPREGTSQPAGLTVQMHPYQLQSLAFMQEQEARPGGFRDVYWAEMETVGGTKYWYSPMLKRGAMVVPEADCGGLLCEEMGLGKTVEVLGLILSRPRVGSLPAPVPGGAPGERTLYSSRATLVVCAVSLVGQWIAEAQKKLSADVRIHQYHGTARMRDPKRMAEEFDIVVTTYATLSADWGVETSRRLGCPKRGKLDVEWHRVVLDESHTVKSVAVGHSKAAGALRTRRRWCCTGTPVCTSVDDIYGQACFLRLFPLSDRHFYTLAVKHAMPQLAHTAQLPLDLMYAMHHCCIRHTKKQEIGGKAVMELPPMKEERVAVRLGRAERERYKEVHAKARANWLRYKAQGAAWVSRNLLQIMSFLLPLRKICSGGSWLPADLQIRDRRAEAAAAADKAPEAVEGPAAGDDECGICLDTLDEPMRTPCGHWYCKECILGALEYSTRGGGGGEKGKCPHCRANVEPTALAPAKPRQSTVVDDDDDGGGGDGTEDPGGVDDPATAGGRRRRVPCADPLECDSKLRALLAHLKQMREADPTSKALVFSQYSTTLDWLKVRLPEEGFDYRTITGSMPLNQRSKSIAAFQSDPPTTVFLLSMRSGAVGINLTAADHVFLLEPALNPALEEQAIGRAWRMGQTRPVTVKRFYVEHSVEARIMDVMRERHHGKAAVGEEGGGGGAGQATQDSQDDSPPTSPRAEGGATAGASGARMTAAQRRRAAAREASGASPLGSGRRGGGKVRVEDVAGAIKSDKQMLRVEELDTLFAEEAADVAVAAPPAGGGGDVGEDGGSGPDGDEEMAEAGGE